jgi:hypothetical protein
MDRTPASDRCKLETDAGYTKADLGNTTNSETGQKAQHKRYFCIHFAHGICAKGVECTFYHRIPLPEDDARTDELVDCFGRQRHSKHKDDMSGIGSFMKPCRTLFIGNLLKTKYDSPQALEDALWRHFGEWGELESLNVIHRLSIAFPRYRLRTSAEFAKEAMHCQALDGNEILSIRWAHDDPNPVARDSIQRADKDALAALLRAKGISITPAGFEYPSSYALPETKRLKVDDQSPESTQEILQQYPELAYPDTDNQYAAYYQQQLLYQQQYQQYLSTQQLSSTTTTTTTATTTRTAALDGSTKQDALSRLGLLAEEKGEDVKEEISKETTTKGDDSKEEQEEEEEEESGGGWEECMDDNTGAVYYFNTATGESSWTKPTDSATGV